MGKDYEREDILRNMRISVIGSGYVGLVTGTGLASKGHDVICVDKDKTKVDKINEGEPPIYEEGLKDMLQEVTTEGYLRATDDIFEAVKNSDLTFLCVGTPSLPDGSIDTTYIEEASKDIAAGLKEKLGYHVVCVKSTVLPGTTDHVVMPIIEEGGKEIGPEVGLGMNPEFLREGVALKDFMEPDRIVIGGSDEKSIAVINEAYEEFDAPVIKTDLRTAECIKYASNALLATKISFANEFALLCEEVGVDVYDVMDAVGKDHRICRQFLNAGCGFGGSCFPKDLKALVDFSKAISLKPRILEAVLKVNEEQPIHAIDMLTEEIGRLSGKKIAVLGLTFKPDTDDVRETRALPMVRSLLQRGAHVFAYDPMGMENFSELVDGIEYVDTAIDALKNSDGCVIQTAWDEFKTLKADDFHRMKSPVIIDCRRVLNPEIEKEDVVYRSIGLG